MSKAARLFQFKRMARRVIRSPFFLPSLYLVAFIPCLIAGIWLLTLFGVFRTEFDFIVWWEAIVFLFACTGFGLLGVFFYRIAAKKETKKPRKLYPSESGLLRNRTVLISLLSTLIAVLLYYSLGRIISRTLFWIEPGSGHRTNRDLCCGNFFGTIGGTISILLFHLGCPYLKKEEKKKGILPIIMTAAFVNFGGIVFPLCGNDFVYWLTQFRFSISRGDLVDFFCWLFVVLIGFLLGVPFTMQCMGVKLSRKPRGAQKAGEQIRVRRTDMGYSQDEVASKLNISRSYYAKIESGKANLTPDLAKNIENLLEITLEFEEDKEEIEVEET